MTPLTQDEEGTGQMRPDFESICLDPVRGIYRDVPRVDAYFALETRLGNATQLLRALLPLLGGWREIICEGEGTWASVNEIDDQCKAIVVLLREVQP